MAEYIIPAAAMVAVAIIEAVAARDRKQVKKDREEEQQRRKDQQELVVLLIQSSGAAIALGEATAHALQRGHTNGDTEAALEYATTIKHKQKDFLTRQGVHDMLG